MTNDILIFTCACCNHNYYTGEPDIIHNSENLPPAEMSKVCDDCFKKIEAYVLKAGLQL